MWAKRVFTVNDLFKKNITSVATFFNFILMITTPTSRSFEGLDLARPAGFLIPIKTHSKTLKFFPTDHG